MERLERASSNIQAISLGPVFMSADQHTVLASTELEAKHAQQSAHLVPVCPRGVR